MVRTFLVTVLALAVAAVVAGFAVGGNGNGNNKTFQYAVGLWGDLPYSAVQENPGIPNLIADMNAADLQFTVNDGDLKAGNGTSGNPARYTTWWGSSLPRTAGLLRIRLAVSARSGSV